MLRTLLRYLSALAGCLTAIYGMQSVAYHILRTGSDTDDARLGNVRRSATMEYRVEGAGISHWLDHGIRDNGNPFPARGRPTVLMLGDSFLESLHVNDLETMTSLAERELYRSDWPIRILNAGHSERSVADYIELAPRYRQVFRPDWVLVLVRDPDFLGDAWLPHRRHFVQKGQALTVSGDDPNAPVPLPPSGLDLFLIELPYRLELGNLWNLYITRKYDWLRRWEAQPPLFQASQPTPEPPSPPKRPLEQELLALAQAYQGRLSLLYLPAFAAPQGKLGSSVQARIGELCRIHGIDYVDLGEQFTDLVQQGHAPFGFPNTRYNDGHLNPRGHAAVSRALIRALQRLHQRGVL